MVRAVAFGRAGATIAAVAEAVHRLNEVGVASAVASAARNLTLRRRDVEHTPVMEGAARRIGIVDDERQAAGAGRRVGPAELGRLVGTVTGVNRRDRLAILNVAAGHRELGDGGAVVHRIVLPGRSVPARAAARESGDQQHRFEILQHLAPGSAHEAANEASTLPFRISSHIAAAPPDTPLTVSGTLAMCPPVRAT